MIRVDEAELKRALSIAFAVARNHLKSGRWDDALVGHLVAALRRYAIYREEQEHELALSPLPLFPDDVAHLRLKRAPGIVP